MVDGQNSSAEDSRFARKCERSRSEQSAKGSKAPCSRGSTSSSSSQSPLRRMAPCTQAHCSEEAELQRGGDNSVDQEPPHRKRRNRRKDEEHGSEGGEPAGKRNSGDGMSEAADASARHKKRKKRRRRLQEERNGEEMSDEASAKEKDSESNLEQPSRRPRSPCSRSTQNGKTANEETASGQGSPEADEVPKHRKKRRRRIDEERDAKQDVSDASEAPRPRKRRRKLCCSEDKRGGANEGANIAQCPSEAGGPPKLRKKRRCPRSGENSDCENSKSRELKREKAAKGSDGRRKGKKAVPPSDSENEAGAQEARRSEIPQAQKEEKRTRKIKKDKEGKVGKAKRHADDATPAISDPKVADSEKAKKEKRDKKEKKEHRKENKKALQALGWPMLLPNAIPPVRDTIQGASKGFARKASAPAPPASLAQPPARQQPKVPERIGFVEKPGWPFLNEEWTDNETPNSCGASDSSDAADARRPIAALLGVGDGFLPPPLSAPAASLKRVRPKARPEGVVRQHFSSSTAVAELELSGPARVEATARPVEQATPEIQVERQAGGDMRDEHQPWVPPPRHAAAPPPGSPWTKKSVVEIPSAEDLYGDLTPAAPPPAPPQLSEAKVSALRAAADNGGSPGLFGCPALGSTSSGAPAPAPSPREPAPSKNLFGGSNSVPNSLAFAFSTSSSSTAGAPSAPSVGRVHPQETPRLGSQGAFDSRPTSLGAASEAAPLDGIPWRPPSLGASTPDGQNAQGLLTIGAFLGEWRDSMGHSVHVDWARPGFRGGQLDVLLSRPGSGAREPIRLNVKDLGLGRFACGHYELDVERSHSGRIVWVDVRNRGKRSVWER